MVASQRAGVGRGIISDLEHGAPVLGGAPRSQWTAPPTLPHVNPRGPGLAHCTVVQVVGLVTSLSLSGLLSPLWRSI